MARVSFDLVTELLGFEKSQVPRDRKGSGDAFVCGASSPLADSFVFAGRQNGEVIGWQPTSMARSRGNAVSSETVETKSAQIRIVTFGSHKGCVCTIAYYPAKKLLFTGSADCSVCMWDPLQVYQRQTGQYRLQLVPAHDATVTNMAVHCNVLITGSADKTVKIWSFDDRREGLALPFLVAKQAFVFDGWITSIFATLSKLTEVQSEDVFIGDNNGFITTLHSIMAPLHQKGKATEDVGVLQMELVRHMRPSSMEGGDSGRYATTDTTSRAITGIVPISSVNSLITLGFDRNATLYDAAKGTILSQISHPEGATRGSCAIANRFIDVLYFAEREEIVLLDNRGVLYLWGTQTNQFLCERRIPTLGKRLLHAGSTQQSTRGDNDRFWVLSESGAELLRIVHIKAVTELQGHEGRILATSVNPTSEYAAVSSGRMSADQSNENEGTGGDSVSDVAFATAGVDNKICFWSSRLSILRTMSEKYSEISAFLFAPHMDLCITGHDNGSVKLWTLSRERHTRFQAHDNTVAAVCEGQHRLDKRSGSIVPWQHLFTISFDGCLAVWEMLADGAKPKCEGRVRVSNSELVVAAYDSIKPAYVVGDNSGSITVWSVDLKPLSSLQHHVRGIMRGPSQAGAAPTTTQRGTMKRRPAHVEAVTAIALDGNIAISGGEDRRLYLWNTVTGELIKELTTSFRVAEVTVGENDSLHRLAQLRSGSAPVFGEVQQILVIPETGDILVSTRSGLMMCFNQASGAPISVYVAAAEVSAMSWNPFASEVLVGLDNGTVLRVPLHMFVGVQGETATDEAAEV